MGKQGILEEEMPGMISPVRISYWFPHNINKTFEVVWFKHILFHIFLNTSIHLHRHYMSMLIYKRDSKKAI